MIGCPRSGTTLLGNVMGGHSHIASGDESLFLLDMWNVFYKYSLTKNRRGAEYLSSYTTQQQHLQYIADYTQGIFSDLIDSKTGAVFAVDHTPVYGHIFHFLELLFCDPIYVHIIREEDAVLDSLKRVQEAGAVWGQPTVQQRRAFRKHWVDTSKDIVNYAPDRYFELRYEDLLANPQSTLKEPLQALGLEWESSMKHKFATRYAQVTT